MTSNPALATSLEASAGSPASLDGFTVDTGALGLFSSWPAPVTVPAFKPREVSYVLALSALLHVGLATAAFRGGQEPHHDKRLSRVEVELTRRPEPPKPLTAPVPPPPPKLVRPELKQVALAPKPDLVEPAAAANVEPSTDTGSSAPAEEGGELQAGVGGLGTAAPAPVAPPPVPRAEPVIEAREGANYLKNPRPAYPRRAKREGWEGTTLLRVFVQSSGKPGAITVQRSSGHDLLDEAAAETVAQWTFVPRTLGGKSMAGSVTVPIVFRLQ